MIDLDHFKKINDQFGHSFGDQVLKKVVGFGEKLMRKTDVFGRSGGEEFIIFLPNTSCYQAQKIAERFRCTVEQYTWQVKKPFVTSFTTSISLGVASNGDCALDEQYDLTKLMNKADHLLYKAKEQGRNQVCS